MLIHSDRANKRHRPSPIAEEGRGTEEEKGNEYPNENCLEAMPVQIDRHLINRMPWLIELRGTHPELVIRYGSDAILIVPIIVLYRDLIG